MVDRVSALAGHYHTGHHGAAGEAGVTLQDMTGLLMHQIAAWPDTLAEVGEIAAKAVDVDAAPGPCQAATGSKGSLLRIEPLKWWVFGAEAPVSMPRKGRPWTSHIRVPTIRVNGRDSAEFLNRHMSLDLRDTAFPMGSVGSTPVHHVGVTLWRSENGYELFIPRGFALSLWEGLTESAEQFGLQVI